MIDPWGRLWDNMEERIPETRWIHEYGIAVLTAGGIPTVIQLPRRSLTKRAETLEGWQGLSSRSTSPKVV
ncbi:hypothetical protein I7I48_05007 [Histoplasma ohiense]|nr:hypothetical protein I7I48_05007 [Histoplasma ohiense (nom. inval.)]